MTRLTETPGSLTRAAWSGIEHAPSSHTLKFLRTSRSLDPTSHNPMSPTLVPTEPIPNGNIKSQITWVSQTSKPIHSKWNIGKKLQWLDKPRSRVCWTGWKSMLMGEEPWFKVRVTVFGKSSGALKAWLWLLCPGNVTGKTLTGRFTCRTRTRLTKRKKEYHKGYY